MTPRPIHRWKLFWLGILVLTFLAWAWLRSIDWIDWHCYGYGGDSRIEFANHTGTLLLIIGESEGIIGTQGYFRMTEPVSGNEAPFPHSLQIIRQPRQFSLQITHRLLALYFLIPWTVILAWRAWRQRRKHRRLTASTPATSG